MFTTIIRTSTIAASAILALALAGPASAHVTATPSATGADEHTVVTLAVPHGCDGSPTKQVAVQLPESIVSVTPTRNPYYDVAVETEKLAEPIEGAHGEEITTRDALVIYTAEKPLPEGQRDTFELSLQLPEDAAGETLAFPTVQTCVKGETGWTQIAAEGEDSHELESPAPTVTVTEAKDGGHGEHSGEDAQTETAAADEGTDALTYVGLGAGLSGAVLGAAALARTRKNSTT